MVDYRSPPQLTALHSAIDSLLPVEPMGLVIADYHVSEQIEHSSKAHHVKVLKQGEDIHFCATKTIGSRLPAYEGLGVGLASTMSIQGGRASFACGMMFGASIIQIEATEYGLFVSVSAETHLKPGVMTMGDGSLVRGHYYTPSYDKESFQHNREVILEALFKDDLSVFRGDLSALGGSVTHIDDWVIETADAIHRDVQTLNGEGQLMIQRYRVEFNPGSIVPKSHSFVLFSYNTIGDPDEK